MSPPSGAQLTGFEIRAMYRGKGALSDAIVQVMNHKPGWDIREQGHGVRLYCRCGSREHQFSVSKTPRDTAREAQRVLNQASRFESEHDADQRATSGVQLTTVKPKKGVPMPKYALDFVVEPFNEVVEDRLLEAGMSSSGVEDAHVSDTQEGPDFLTAAKRSAQGIELAGARIIRMDLDLVNQAGIAERAKVSRQAVTDWVNNRLKDAPPFPRPFTRTNSGPLWAWGDVNEWLRGRGTDHDPWITPNADQVTQFNALHSAESRRNLVTA